MKKIISNLKEGILIFDGAMGTMLQKYGLPIQEVQAERFNVSHPEIVTSIHQMYVEAGADIITTNTFQANSYRLDSAELPFIITQAVELAKHAKPRFVAYDMGPIGKMMPPKGNFTYEEAYDLFKEQSLIAEDAGVDFIAIETMWDLVEVKAAIRAVKENTNLPVFATMTFQKSGETSVGVTAKTAALALQNYGADALGVNCSFGPVELLPVIQTMLEQANVPVIVQANAGLPETINHESVYTITIEEYTQAVIKMLDMGVQIIGGCCGTTPDFIRSIKKAVEQCQ